MKTRNILVLIIEIAVLGGLYLFLSSSVELSETSREREFELTISNRRLNLDPPIIRLNQNDEVTFTITADEDAEFHVHTYEVETEVGPPYRLRVRFMREGLPAAERPSLGEGEAGQLALERAKAGVRPWKRRELPSSS